MKSPRTHLACALCALAILSAPAAASANVLENARFEVRESEVALHIDASADLGAPLVRTEAGRVRVWFPGMDEDVRLDPEADGTALRHIRIRPGFGDTSVIVLRVGDGRTVPVSAVRVERTGPSGTIFIPRSALPAIPEAAPEPVPAEPDAADAEPEEATQEEAQPSAAADAAPEEATPGEESEQDAAAPLFAEESEEVSPLTADSTSGIGLLMLVSMLLGGAYLLLRTILGKKKRKSPESDIQIISAKRLSPRHQIVLVRALGEDHLLSINGQHTQCITSTPTLADEEGLGDVDAQESGILSRLRERIDPTARAAAALRREETDEDKEQSSLSLKAQRDDNPEAKRFGAELFRFALESEKTPPPKLEASRSATPRRRRESEAVAGLVKLRERLAQSA